jgi:hypothetical protein
MTDRKVKCPACGRVYIQYGDQSGNQAACSPCRKVKPKKAQACWRVEKESECSATAI